jgi:hypothetical protein
VNVLATLLVGLAGGLIGGAAAVVGWTAMTRRRRPPAAGTLTVIAATGVVAATLLLGTAPPAAAATSDSLACTDCAPLFDSLRADVAAYVPTTQQPVFLAAIDQASLAAGVVETFPPDPIQPDVVAASVILDRLTADTSDLQAAAVVSDDGLAAITTDINRLEAEFFLPTDPCQVVSFDSLRADVAAYVPTTQQPVFLSALDAAEPQAAADVVAASVILDGLTADTSDLQVAGQVSDDGLSAIVTDINSLEAEFFIPIDPC